MRHSLMLGGLVLLLVATTATADTKSGKTNPDKLVTYEVVSLFGGTMNATLTWQKKSAELFVVMVCELGVDALEWGVSASFEDRIQRLDTGVPPLVLCLYGISSFSGASKFYFNVQESSDAFPSSSRSRGALRLRQAAPSRELIEMAARVRATSRTRR